MKAPAGTTQLATRLDFALSAVGDHLAVLRRPGLLESSRAARSVLYRRTALGYELAGGVIDIFAASSRSPCRSAAKHKTVSRRGSSPARYVTLAAT